MICGRCVDAAARRAPRDQHCDAEGGPGCPCDCQHRTDRYRTDEPPFDPPFDAGPFGDRTHPNRYA